LPNAIVITAPRLLCDTVSAPLETAISPIRHAPFDLADPARIKLGQDCLQSTCTDFCHGHTPALFFEREGLASSGSAHSSAHLIPAGQ
jgi:hypothetical protein